MWKTCSEEDDISDKIKMERKHEKLRFVVEHYDDEAFDKNKSWDVIRRRTGIRRHLSAWNPVLQGRRLWIGAAAAAVLAVALPAAMRHLGTRSIDYAANGTASVFILPDFTKMVLSSGSRARVIAGRKSETVELDGSAFFHVGPGRAGKFKVMSRNNSVAEVLGTEFQIMRTDTSVRVDVVSGMVKFNSLILSEGMSAEKLNWREEAEIVDSGMLNPAAWATGRFVYESAPFEEVLKDLSIFYDTKLSICRDSLMTNMPEITGAFTAGDLDEVLSLIGDVSGVRIRADR